MIRDPVTTLRPAPPHDHERDLTTWAWRRATSVAVGVPLAALLGGVMSVFGAIVGGVVAAAFGYVLGPVVALAERWRTGAVDLSSPAVRRHWGTVAVLALVGAGLLAPEPFRGSPTWITVGLGIPIAIVTVTLAVSAGRHLSRRLGRTIAVAVPGTGIAAVAIVRLRDGDTPPFGILEVVLLAAVAMLIPLTLRLLDRDARTAVTAAVLTPLTGLGIALPPQRPAALLVLPAVAAALGLALTRTVRWLVWDRTARALPPVVATGYLAVAALWLLADRLELRPVGFGPPFVQLTAIHFVYAGLVTTTLAWLAWRRVPGNRLAVAGVTTAIAGPPMVAVGFLLVPVLQIAGAVALTIATWASAWIVWRHVRPRAPDRTTRLLLTTSALAAIGPMVLAIVWAVGHVVGTPAPPIPVMSWTHGLVNALGTCLCGVLGWRRLLRAQQAPATDG